MNEDTHVNEPAVPYGQPITVEQILQIIRETDKLLKEQFMETNRRMQETDRRMQETDRQMQETDRQMQETDRQMQETDRRFDETRRLMDKQIKESEQSRRETDRILKELRDSITGTDQKISRLKNDYTDDWGDLVESLVKGDLIKLLREKGIQVIKNLENYEGCVEGENFEYDIIAINKTEVVIVEVKSMLRVGDVKHFIQKLKKAKYFMPEYTPMKIYGAVAFLNARSASEVMAENKGLFVIKATGNSSSIINAPGFVPRVF